MNRLTTRFAPSPTGRLHLGHAFSAIQAHDLARNRGGRFLLRIEDIDGTRSRGEHVRAILDDLAWLGLEWDGAVTFQSQRLDLYRAALDRLKASGLVYPCFCTRAEISREIAAAGSAPHGPDGPIYPGNCRSLSDEERSRRMAGPHAWRLDMAKALAAVRCVTPFPSDGRQTSLEKTGQNETRHVPANVRASECPGQNRELPWHDELAGAQIADPAAFGDVVLARKDAPSSYHLAVTVDDAAQRVTHVVRGRDLFTATHVHRLLQALLGLPTPVYRHHPLLTDVDGKRLAKRSGAPSLESLRLAGVDGLSLANDLRRDILPSGFLAQIA